MLFKHFQYIVLISLLSFIACERAIEKEIDPVYSKKISVESILTSEFKNQTIKLTAPFYQVDTTPTPINGAIVSVLQNDKKINFFESGDSTGIYYSEFPFAASIDIEYQLMIIYKTDTFTASANLIPATPIEKIPYEKSWKTDSLFLMSNDFVSSEEAMWQIEIDWRYLPGYDNDSNRALIYLYTFSSIDVNQVFAPNKEIIEFPKGTILRVKKYALHPDHASFYRSVLSEVEWSGGYFDVAPANTSTNISNNACGWFGVCTVINDSLIVQ